jgi:hypothetical protein
MGWRVVLVVLVAMTGCAEPFTEEYLGGDAGLRDGEIPPNVAREHCYRWICEGVPSGVTVRRSCGGLDEYHCL